MFCCRNALRMNHTPLIWGDTALHHSPALTKGPREAQNQEPEVIGKVLEATERERGTDRPRGHHIPIIPSIPLVWVSHEPTYAPGCCGFSSGEKGDVESCQAQGYGSWADQLVPVYAKSWDALGVWSCNS